MQPGRTPNWNVVAALAPDTWLEAVDVASGDRLPLPAVLRKRVSWCAPEGTLPLLASVEADGSVLVGPLSARQDELTSIRQALATASPADSATITFAAMATYSQVSLQPDGRLRLSPPLTRHLGAGGGGSVWVGAHRDTIRLWSDGVWREMLSRSSAALREAAVVSRGPA